MGSILASVDGYKTYILLGVAAAVVLVEGFLGLDIPGVKYESQTGNWLTDLWALGVGATARSAIG